MLAQSAYNAQIAGPALYADVVAVSRCGIVGGLPVRLAAHNLGVALVEAEVGITDSYHNLCRGISWPPKRYIDGTAGDADRHDAARLSQGQLQPPCPIEHGQRGECQFAQVEATRAGSAAYFDMPRCGCAERERARTPPPLKERHA